MDLNQTNESLWLREWGGWLNSNPSEVGVGIDVEHIERWQRPLKLDMLFTAAERQYCQTKASPATHYAGFWCAKEAVFKALSNFFVVDLRQIEVIHTVSGSPRIRLLKANSEKVECRITISISHTTSIAAAIAIYLPLGEMTS